MKWSNHLQEFIREMLIGGSFSALVITIAVLLLLPEFSSDKLLFLGGGSAATLITFAYAIPEGEP